MLPFLLLHPFLFDNISTGYLLLSSSQNCITSSQNPITLMYTSKSLFKLDHILLYWYLFPFLIQFQYTYYIAGFLRPLPPFISASGPRPCPSTCYGPCARGLLQLSRSTMVYIQDINEWRKVLINESERPLEEFRLSSYYLLDFVGDCLISYYISALYLVSFQDVMP